VVLHLFVELYVDLLQTQNSDDQLYRNDIAQVTDYGLSKAKEQYSLCGLHGPKLVSPDNVECNARPNFVEIC
jgi:hypothetical protein